MISENPEKLTEAIIVTEDGSQTVISPIFKERYHSIYGAKTESDVVFIHSGLGDKIDLNEINVLELGFGTGLNAVLAWKYASENDKVINYTGFEKYPVKLDVITKLNYGKLLDFSEEFTHLHQASWNIQHQLDGHFQFCKIDADINTLKYTNEYDVIFFDAFAPAAQEELWTTEIFQLMYDSLKTNGILVTYCAKGQVKRNLKAAGFTIEPLPGPPGKREITRARKN